MSNALFAVPVFPFGSRAVPITGRMCSLFFRERSASSVSRSSVRMSSMLQRMGMPLLNFLVLFSSVMMCVTTRL